MGPGLEDLEKRSGSGSFMGDSAPGAQAMWWNRQQELPGAWSSWVELSCGTSDCSAGRSRWGTSSLGRARSWRDNTPCSAGGLPLVSEEYMAGTKETEGEEQDQDAGAAAAGFVCRLNHHGLQPPQLIQKGQILLLQELYFVL